MFCLCLLNFTAIIVSEDQHQQHNVLHVLPFKEVVPVHADVVEEHAAFLALGQLVQVEVNEQLLLNEPLNEEGDVGEVRRRLLAGLGAARCEDIRPSLELGQDQDGGMEHGELDGQI